MSSLIHFLIAPANQFPQLNAEFSRLYPGTLCGGSHHRGWISPVESLGCPLSGERRASKRVLSIQISGVIKYRCFSSCNNCKAQSILVSFLLFRIYWLFYPSAHLANVPCSPDYSFKLSVVHHSLPLVGLLAFVSFSHPFNSPAFLAPQQKPPNPYQKGCVLSTRCIVTLSPSFNCPAHFICKLFEAEAILQQILAQNLEEQDLYWAGPQAQNSAAFFNTNKLETHFAFFIY